MKLPYLLMNVSLIALSGSLPDNSGVNAKLNSDATLAGNIPVDPLSWRVITSGVDRPNTTMFTLFGNDAAVNYARTCIGQDYPVGSTIALASWHQQEDSRWLGGKIPAQPLSVEFVDIERRFARGRSKRYRAYEGSPLKQTTSSNSQAERRTAYILSLRAAVMP